MQQKSESLYELGGCTNIPRAGVALALRQVLCASATLPRTFSRLALSVLLSWLIAVTALGTTYNERPWWTERSSFVFGDTIYAVGVASHAQSIEEGRQKAFENGKRELQNLIQLSSLEGLVIGTQMTYEEPHDDGTVTVYRLLHVPSEQLLRSKEEPKSQHQANASLSSATQSTMAIPEECMTFKRCSLCDAEPLDKEGQVRCAQRKRVEARWAAEEKALKERLEEADRRLAIENPAEHAKRKALRSAHERVEAEKKEKRRACERLRVGFTRDEVELIVGKPSEEQRLPASGFVQYLDGRLTLSFDKTNKLDSLADCTLAFTNY